MKYFLLFLVFIGVRSVLGQLQIGDIYDDSKNEVTLRYATDSFEDSTTRQFLVFAIDQKNRNYRCPKDSTDFFPSLLADEYYCYLAEVYVQRSDCKLYPVFSRTESRVDSLFVEDSCTVMDEVSTYKAYYLVEDFRKRLDSVTIHLEYYSGWMQQSQMNRIHHQITIPFESENELDTNLKVANRKWYKEWVREHQGQYNERGYRSSYGGCPVD